MFRDINRSKSRYRTTALLQNRSKSLIVIRKALTNLTLINNQQRFNTLDLYIIQITITRSTDYFLRQPVLTTSVLYTIKTRQLQDSSLAHNSLARDNSINTLTTYVKYTSRISKQSNTSQERQTNKLHLPNSLQFTTNTLILTSNGA